MKSLYIDKIEISFPVEIRFEAIEYFYRQILNLKMEE